MLYPTSLGLEIVVYEHGLTVEMPMQVDDNFFECECGFAHEVHIPEIQIVRRF